MAPRQSTILYTILVHRRVLLSDTTYMELLRSGIYLLLMAQTVLVTGATDGIGLALARLYQAAGDRLVLVGRRPLDSLSDRLFSDHNYCQSDLSQSDCATPIATFLDTHEIRTIDVLIHNAGIGEFGEIVEREEQDVVNMIAVNFAAPVAITHTLLSRMTQGTGKIVFVSSVVSNMPAPNYPHYAATKAALDGFARSLRVELKGRAHVLVIRPGATRTGMHKKSGISLQHMDWRNFPSADKVAQRLFHTIRSNARTATIGWSNVGLRLLGWSPGVLDRAMRQKRTGAFAKQEGERTVLITGAADGIGKALAFRFGREDYRVVGVDVDGQKALQTKRESAQAGLDLDFVVADLAENDAISAVIDRVSQPGVDIVIHNAGINATGYFDRIAFDQQQRVIDVNFCAPLLLHLTLLKEGILSQTGCSVFVSSLSTFVSYPGASVYAGTKDGLASYARSLRAGCGLRQVLTVYPGPTQTAHARRHSPDNSREANRMPPEILADRIYQAVERNAHVLVPGMGNKIAAALGKLAPKAMEWAMCKVILEKVGKEDR